MPAGTNVASGSLISPGGQQGIPGPNAISTDAGNQATFGSDSRIYVPDPTPIITSVRLRSFNAIGNPNFEVDQRYCGVLLSNIGTGMLIDRWSGGKNGGSTMTINTQQMAGPVLLPGTNFAISSKFLRITLTAQQASLAAADLVFLTHVIEGCTLRELISDVSSIQVLVRSSVAGLNFGVSVRDGAAGNATRSLTKLATLSAAGTWTLLPFPNFPVFPAGGTFPITPGSQGALVGICLASGSTYMSPANDTWQNGNFLGAVGQSNFATQAVNSTFDVAFVQHEPGPLCTGLMDKPFAGANGNLEECLRYYTKSYGYATAIGAVTVGGQIACSVPAAFNPLSYVPFKKVMAKAPTVTVYSPATGAVNAVRDSQAATDRGFSGAAGLTDSGYSGLTLASQNANATTHTWQYVADTGW